MWGYYRDSRTETGDYSSGLGVWSVGSQGLEVQGWGLGGKLRSETTCKSSTPASTECWASKVAQDSPPSAISI